MPEPARGWVAYFVELTFASHGPFPFKFTTEIRVIPEILPFGPPPEMTSGARERPKFPTNATRAAAPQRVLPSALRTAQPNFSLALDRLNYQFRRKARRI